MWKCTVALASITFLAGCAPSSVIDLRQKTEPVVFSINKPYQRVFKDINNELNRCVSAGFLFASTSINSQLYPDLKEAEISATNYNLGDQSAFLDIQIAGDTENAQVKAYSADIGIWRGSAQKIKNFVAYDNPYCD